MKKTIVLALIFSSIIFSCVSFPERTRDEQCLIIMKVETTNDIDSKSFAVSRDFLFKFSGDYPVAYINSSSRYAFWIISEPAVKVIALRSYISDTNVRGEDSVQKLDIILPYEPGKAIILDNSFAIHTKKIDDFSFNTSWDFKKLSPAEVNEFVNSLKKDGKLKNWDL